MKLNYRQPQNPLILPFIIACILAMITFVSCSKKEDTQPQETRQQVLDRYKKDYGMDSMKWSDRTQKQFDKDFEKAKAD